MKNSFKLLGSFCLMVMFMTNFYRSWLIAPFGLKTICNAIVCLVVLLFVLSQSKRNFLGKGN